MSRTTAWIILGGFGLFFWMAAFYKGVLDPQLFAIPVIIGGVCLFYWAVYVAIFKDEP